MILQFSGCDQFGSIPKDDDYLRMKKSSNYNIPEDKFVNQNPDVMENVKKNSGFWANPRKNMANNYFFNSNKTEPETMLPEDKTSLNENFVKSSNNIKFAWLGHSSILMSINNKIILIDPIFSSSASPFSWLIKRYQPPVFKLKELPKIDFILISHDHYDHLDMKTIKFFNKNKDISFVVPLGVGSHLKKWGVEKSRITEMDWWDTKIIKGIKFICTPAQHFSGRKAFIETQKSLWASWVVKSGKRSFYFSGDSGYAKHYKEIGDKLNSFFFKRVEYSDQANIAINAKISPLLKDKFNKLFKFALVIINKTPVSERNTPVIWKKFVFSILSKNENNIIITGTVDIISTPVITWVCLNE